MSDNINLPEPHCYIYEWDSHFGTHRSTTSSRWNGREPDRSCPIYTADQVRDAVEADRLRREVTMSNARKDSAVFRYIDQKVAAEMKKFEDAFKCGDQGRHTKGPGVTNAVRDGSSYVWTRF